MKRTDSLTLRDLTAAQRRCLNYARMRADDSRPQHRQAYPSREHPARCFEILRGLGLVEMRGGHYDITEAGRAMLQALRGKWCSVVDTAYPLNTPEEVAAARAAYREVEEWGGFVWLGELDADGEPDPASVQTDEKIHAAEPEPEGILERARSIVEASTREPLAPARARTIVVSIEPEPAPTPEPAEPAPPRAAPPDYDNYRVTVDARHALEMLGNTVLRIGLLPPPPHPRYRIVLHAPPPGLVECVIGDGKDQHRGLRLMSEPAFEGEWPPGTTAWHEQGRWTACPSCGGALVWFEAGYVPGYRICTRGHHVQLDASGTSASAARPAVTEYIMLGERTLPVGSIEELEAAARELAEAGVPSAAVYVSPHSLSWISDNGDPDGVETKQRVFASTSRMFAAIGSDGTREVVWGIGPSEEEAEAEAREQAAAEECDPELDRIVAITAEITRRIEAGVVSVAELGL